MFEAMETGIYLLTQTHVGTGQAAGAVDLPIAREAHTGFPYLPATALKGVARDDFESVHGEKKTSALFGPPPPQPQQDPGEKLYPGKMVITDGHLLAFPIRSLTAPFLWITSPLIIERWRRLRAAWGLQAPTFAPIEAPAATFRQDAPLVLQDHLVDSDQVAWNHPDLEAVAAAWLRLIGLPSCRQDASRPGAPPEFPGGPSHGESLARQFMSRLVCLPDEDFSYLVQTATPVSARVQLTPGKTTDRWKDPDSGVEYRGNLWYEETLPSECLFSAVIVSRVKGEKAFGDLRQHFDSGRVVQVGGNETVGQGLCWWVRECPAGGSSSEIGGGKR